MLKNCLPQLLLEEFYPITKEEGLTAKVDQIWSSDIKKSSSGLSSSLNRDETCFFFYLGRLQIFSGESAKNAQTKNVSAILQYLLYNKYCITKYLVKLVRKTSPGLQNPDAIFTNETPRLQNPDAIFAQTCLCKTSLTEHWKI